MKTVSVTRLLAVAGAAALLAACGSMSSPAAPAYSQDALPDAVKVPAGNVVALETVGTGTIVYECRDKANAPGVTEWVFVGPAAVLTDRSGKTFGKYYGPPATWEANDGSRLTGTQLAVAPSGAGNLPYQLVKANPAVGTGVLTGVSHIQRVALKGGVAPSAVCNTDTKGQKQTVNYQADYIFWKSL